MFDPSAVLMIGLVCLVVGLVVGVLLASLRNSGMAKAQPPEGDHAASVEGVRLWRDKTGDRLLIELDGQRIEGVDKLTSGQQMRLEKAAEDFTAWLRKSPAGRREAHPGSRPETRAELAPPVVKPARQDPVDLLVKAVQTDVKKVTVERSIAAQIDEILQERLSSPAYAASELKNKGIRLMELPGKGLVVLVGLEQYTGIDEVPDAEVQALIRSCVAEWEERMSSGSR